MTPDATTDWRPRAACLDKDPSLWFPSILNEEPPRRRETPRVYKEAKKICLGCPVKQECLDYALEAKEPYGMWGAKTRPERATILRDRRRDARRAARKKSS